MLTDAQIKRMVNRKTVMNTDPAKRRATAIRFRQRHPDYNAKALRRFRNQHPRYDWHNRKTPCQTQPNE